MKTSQLMDYGIVSMRGDNNDEANCLKKERKRHSVMTMETATNPTATAKRIYKRNIENSSSNKRQYC